MNPRRRRSRGFRRNPHRGGGGGGIGLMPLLLIGGAAYFLLLRPGGIGSMFGGGAQPAIAGYTPVGGNYYRNQATGQTVYRNPTTGLMTTAGGAVAPSGVPNWLQPTVQAGAQAIPMLGIGLVQGAVSALSGGIRSLFGESSVMQTSGGAVELPSGALSTSSPDVLSGSYVPSLPSDIVSAPLPSVLNFGAWSETGGVAWPSVFEPAPSAIFAAEMPSLALPTLSLAPVDTSGWWGTGAEYDYYLG